MLELLDLAATMEKDEAHASISDLGDALRELQQSVRATKLPVIVLLEGLEGSGKGDSIGHIVYPLDPRGFKVRTTRTPTDEDRARPFLWRFWKDLPSQGDFVFFDRSWYRALLEDRVDLDLADSEVRARAAEIRDHERQLIEDGSVVIKLWLQVSKKEQQRRLKHRERDLFERWRVARRDRVRPRSRKSLLRAAEEMFELTSTGDAPWHLVEADDPSWRRVRVLTIVTDALRSALSSRASGNGTPRVPGDAAVDPELRERARRVVIDGPRTVLDGVDLSKKLARAEYERRLDPLQKRLRDLGLECYRTRTPVILVYEGWDAAGKGGNIKRLTQELDPRGYEVVPVAAPDAIEKSKHYLWRFWRSLPRHGHLAIYDRSWYGRVLVERVEGFATETQWRRAYDEINGFERHLTEFGTMLVKFWLHLSPEEQLRRFEEREKEAHKMHKITPDDWRNRLKWNAYRAAASEMIERTTTTHAPWTIVEAEDKLWARIRTLETVVAAIGKRFGA